MPPVRALAASALRDAPLGHHPVCPVAHVSSPVAPVPVSTARPLRGMPRSCCWSLVPTAHETELHCPPQTRINLARPAPVRPLRSERCLLAGSAAEGVADSSLGCLDARHDSTAGREGRRQCRAREPGPKAEIEGAWPVKKHGNAKPGDGTQNAQGPRKPPELGLGEAGVFAVTALPTLDHDQSTLRGVPR